MLMLAASMCKRLQAQSSSGKLALAQHAASINMLCFCKYQH
jgi:hypothetical protein